MTLDADAEAEWIWTRWREGGSACRILSDGYKIHVLTLEEGFCGSDLTQCSWGQRDIKPAKTDCAFW